MKIKSIVLALVMAVIAAGTVATTKAYHRYDRYGRYDRGYRRGFLGFGRRYYDGYYPRRSIVGGALATTGNIIEDVTGLPTGDDYYYPRGYYRRGWGW